MIILTLLWLAAVAVAVTVEPKGVARVASLLRGEEFDEDATGGFLKPLQFQDRAAQLARNGTIILLVVNSGACSALYSRAKARTGGCHTACCQRFCVQHSADSAQNPCLSL